MDFLLEVLLLEVALPEVLLPEVLANRADLPRVTFREELLAVFLRVFLDIRLPFVAFSGSIIRLLRVVSRQA